MIRQDWSTLKKLMFMKAAAGGSVIEDTATGNPLTFTTDKAKPLKSLLIPFTPVQSGSGDPSPDNVRPVTGWTGLNVWHGGENLLDKQNVINGYFTTSGNETIIYSSNSGRIVWMPCKPNTTYMCHKMEGGQRFAVYCSENTPGANVVVNEPKVNTGNNSVRKVTTSENAKYLCMFVWLSSADTEITAQEMIDSVMVEAGNVTPSAYEPYTGATIPVDWTDEAGTVYGGTLDLVTGVLTVTYMQKVSDGSVVDDWSFGESSGLYRAICGSSRFNNNPPKASSTSTLKTNYFASASRSAIGNAYISSTNNFICYPPSEITTKEEWLAYLAEHPLQIVYELAEPITVQLTPTQITALIGTNTIWSDTNGENTVVYLKKA